MTKRNTNGKKKDVPCRGEKRAPPNTTNQIHKAIEERVGNKTHFAPTKRTAKKGLTGKWRLLTLARGLRLKGTVQRYEDFLEDQICWPRDKRLWGCRVGYAQNLE